MPIAVIAFDFDPLIRLTDDLVVRWQTVALAAVIAASLIVAGLMVQRASLRADDLLYIAVGVVPGAVIGGRLGYALVHLDVFGPEPARLIDPAVGGLDLAAAVVGGLLTGAYVASLLGAPVGRWAHLLAVPVLGVLGAGKLTMVLGGSGQGLPSDAAWATGYLGPGPWGSLAPALPSIPSQALEGIATLLLAVGVALVAGSGIVRGHDGRLLLGALAGWALLRALVAVTWRDPVVLGPWGAAALLSLFVVVVMLVGMAVASVRLRGERDAEVTEDAGDAPAWPDPEARPRF